MSDSEFQVSVVMPGLNEQESVSGVVESTVTAFKELGIRGELIVIDDGSTDRTGELVQQKMREYPGVVRLIRHEVPHGIGGSFWDGVAHAAGRSVVLLPADNEIDPRQILRYLCLIEHVDMVVPYVVNTGVRPFSRRLTSWLFTRIINATFFTSFQYTNGTVIYRRERLLSLDYRVNNFFFQTDILIHLARKGCLYAQVPYALTPRKGGASKAISLRSLAAVIRAYLRLLVTIYFPKHEPHSRTRPV